MRKHWSRSVDSVMSFWGCLWRNLVAIDQVFQGNIGNVQLWPWHISHPSAAANIQRSEKPVVEMELPRKSTNPPRFWGGDFHHGEMYLRSAQNSAAWSRFKQLVSYGFEHLDTSTGVGWVGGTTNTNTGGKKNGCKTDGTTMIFCVVCELDGQMSITCV